MHSSVSILAVWDRGLFLSWCNANLSLIFHLRWCCNKSIEYLQNMSALVANVVLLIKYMILKNADFRQNSTGSSDCRHHILYIYQQGNISSIRSNINIFSLKPDVRRKRRSHGISRRKQRLNRSLDNLLWIAKNNGRHELLHALSSILLFRYLDWSQSWMRQIEEVYAIQIDLNVR